MTMTRSRMGLVPGLLLALALIVAACGGGGKGEGVASLGGAGSATSTTSAGASGDLAGAAAAFGRCMRQHGIDMPDPRIDGNNIVQPSLGRQVQESTKFQAAEQACNRYLPGGGEPTGPPDPQRLQQMLAFAGCMRQHGIDMPDPQVSGDDQQLPTGMRKDDPRLKAAEQACQQSGGGGR
jgi:hypothetical protein